MTSICISPVTSTPSPTAHNLLSALVDNAIYFRERVGGGRRARSIRVK